MSTVRIAIIAACLLATLLLAACQGESEGTCTGEATPCNSIQMPTACEAHLGCTWVWAEYSRGRCLGAVSSCESQLGEDACTAQHGCTWGPGY